MAPPKPCCIGLLSSNGAKDWIKTMIRLYKVNATRLYGLVYVLFIDQISTKIVSYVLLAEKVRLDASCIPILMLVL
jgi:hypothetical protein